MMRPRSAKPPATPTRSLPGDLDLSKVVNLDSTSATPATTPRGTITIPAKYEGTSEFKPRPANSFLDFCNCGSAPDKGDLQDPTRKECWDYDQQDVLRDVGHCCEGIESRIVHGMYEVGRCSRLQVPLCCKEGAYMPQGQHADGQKRRNLISPDAEQSVPGDWEVVQTTSSEGLSGMKAVVDRDEYLGPGLGAQKPSNSQITQKVLEKPYRIIDDIDERNGKEVVGINDYEQWLMGAGGGFSGIDDVSAKRSKSTTDPLVMKQKRPSRPRYFR